MSERWKGRPPAKRRDLAVAQVEVCQRRQVRHSPKALDCDMAKHERLQSDQASQTRPEFAGHRQRGRVPDAIAEEQILEVRYPPDGAENAGPVRGRTRALPQTPDVERDLHRLVLPEAEQRAFGPSDQGTIRGVDNVHGARIHRELFRLAANLQKEMSH